MQTSSWDVGRAPTLRVASTICKPCRRALAAILSPAEHGREALHALSIRAECKNPHSAHGAAKPTADTRCHWLLSAGFVSLGQK